MVSFIHTLVYISMFPTFFRINLYWIVFWTQSLCRSAVATRWKSIEPGCDGFFLAWQRNLVRAMRFHYVRLLRNSPRSHWKQISWTFVVSSIHNNGNETDFCPQLHSLELDSEKCATDLPPDQPAVGNVANSRKYPDNKLKASVRFSLDSALCVFTHVQMCVAGVTIIFWTLSTLCALLRHQVFCGCYFLCSIQYNLSALSYLGASSTIKPASFLVSEIS